MSRRVSLPAADDLFRPTGDRSTTKLTQAAPAGESRVGEGQSAAGSAAAGHAAVGGSDDATPAKPARKPSGRIRHDEKMTVYVTSDELLDIEHARLMLRRTTGKAVDRGRLVRSAIALALADFEQNGDESALVARLRES